MISLQPREKFAIVRLLGDHTDSTTYYVQAIIRDSITGETLETLGLEDLGDRRFVYQWQVPADTSGLGRYIDITTKVYTDSDYTIEAPAYSEENDSYLIWDRISANKRGGGDSPAFDYKKIKEIMKSCMSEVEPAEMPEPDMTPILDALKSIQASVGNIEIPTVEKVEFAPVMAELSNLGDKIKQSEVAIIDEIQAKEIPDTPTDLTPVLEKLDAMDMTPLMDSTKKIQEAVQMLENQLGKDHLDTFATTLANIKGLITEFMMRVQDTTSNKNTIPLSQRAKNLLGGGQ